MLPEDRVYLVDMLEAARLAMAYVQGASRAEFLRDLRLQDSVIRRLAILGEAARRVTQETRQTLLQVPWAQLIAMRNLLIHEYDDVDADIVWATVQQDLPQLIAELEPLDLASDS